MAVNVEQLEAELGGVDSVAPLVTVALPPSIWFAAVSAIQLAAKCPALIPEAKAHTENIGRMLAQAVPATSVEMHRAMREGWSGLPPGNGKQGENTI